MNRGVRGVRRQVSRACALGLGLVGLAFLLVACGSARAGEGMASPLLLSTRTPTPTPTPTPPYDVEGNYRAGMARLAAWDLEGALARFDEVIAEAPDYAPAYAARARVHWLRGNPEAALADAEQALALDETLAEAHRVRAAALWDLGRPEEALEAADALIALVPEDAQAHLFRAELLLNGLHRPQEALEAYQQALALDPSLDGPTLVARWRALAALNRWEEALRLSVRIALQEPDDPLRYYYRGRSLLGVGDLDRAIKTFVEGIRRYPDLPVVLYYGLGLAYSAGGNWIEAATSLEVAADQIRRWGVAVERPELGITLAEVQARLAVAYLGQQRCDDAELMYQQAMARGADPQVWGWIETWVADCRATPTPEPTPTPEDLTSP